MRFSAVIILVLIAFGAQASAQTPRRPAPQRPAVAKPTPRPAPTPDIDRGVVSGRTYTNFTYGFDVEFPAEWLIPGDDFEEYMKSQGIDLRLKAPDSLTPAAKAQVERSLRNVAILLTAYRSMPGTADNAIARISVESLAANPQIKDAVDYLDAVRATYATMKLPPDFTYSETDAEQLGLTQFGFLDTASKDGKKRMYAIVRNGTAVLFTLSYTKDEDLATLRRVLEEGNFRLKRP